MQQKLHLLVRCRDRSVFRIKMETEKLMPAMPCILGNYQPKWIGGMTNRILL